MFNTALIFRIFRFISLRLFFVLSFFVYSTTYAETLIGEAKYKDKTLYAETHEVVYLKNMLKSINTEYFDTKDVKIGFRQLDFPENHYMPNLVFKDEPHNDTYSLTINGLKGTLKSLIDETPRTMEFKIEDNMVITDSITKYIHDNFGFLMSEQRVVKCLIPTAHKFIDIVIKSEKSLNKEEAVFSIRPKSSLIRLFTSKTLIVYNIQSKQLKKYVGPSNLKNKDKILNVDISYE